MISILLSLILSSTATVSFVLLNIYRRKIDDSDDTDGTSKKGGSFPLIKICISLSDFGFFYYIQWKENF